MAHILIIDDEPEVRLSLKRALRLSGHETTVAANGEEGIHLCRVVLVDLVILDLFMPEKDGLETLTELRKEFPHLPLIAVSGGHPTSAALLAAAEKLGAANILEKPFSPGKLANAIERALTTSQN